MYENKQESLEQICKLAEATMKLVDWYSLRFDSTKEHAHNELGPLLGGGGVQILKQTLNTLSKLGWAKRVSRKPELWSLDWDKLDHAKKEYSALKAKVNGEKRVAKPAGSSEPVLAPVLSCKKCGCGVGELDTFCWQCGNRLCAQGGGPKEGKKASKRGVDPEPVLAPVWSGVKRERTHLTKKQRRMKKAVAYLQKYFETYTNQDSYLDYHEDILINDALYGLGVALDDEAYRFADGFERFKKKLRTHLGA